ncbi:MAG: PhnD/SsuA/transferrin family substrate-binding protein [Verrucomicrobiales bacterium]|nr:PhnD/SsuA/transferrin family substrate-binding protein [Verrucomicrobiales bacterium]
MTRCILTRPEHLLFPSWEAFIGKLRSDPASFADVFPMYGYDFVDLRQECSLEALLVPDFGSGVQVDYGLYVTESSGIASLEDLYRKTITVEIGGRGGLPLYWIDNAIRQRTQFGREEFATFRHVSTPLRAVLPVFFNGAGADGCIVSAQGFEQVVARNPQVAARMRRILSAPSLLSHVIACRKDLADAIRNEVVAVSLAMAQRNGPRFSGPRMSLFQAEMLETLQGEWDAHLQYLNQPKVPGRSEPGTSGERTSGKPRNGEVSAPNLSPKPPKGPAPRSRLSYR